MRHAPFLALKRLIWLRILAVDYLYLGKYRMSGSAGIAPDFQADYVIIGSGSAGSVMADRLSADGKNSVIVVEYGGTDIGPLIQMPAALSIPMNMATYDWG